MNADFVSFSLAKKLKEKGFRKPCVATYDKDGMLGYNYIQHYIQPASIRAIGFDDCLCISDALVLAPTISQVLKWLREEKKLHIIIPASYYECYWWEVRDFNREISEYSDNEFDSYENAAIAVVEYIIDNLI